MRKLGLILVLLAVVRPAWSALTIEITQGTEGAIPIAVVPFGWSGMAGGAPENISAIISADLNRSGRFEVLPDSDLVAHPTEGSQVQFQNWRMVNVDNLVVGKITESGQQYSVQFQLFDVFRGNQIAGYSFNVGRQELRRVAHHISDMIYEKLTGQRGAFDTRVAYVTSTGGAGGDAQIELKVADADGYNAQTIVTSSEPLMSPAWSPDSRRLAYVSFENDRSSVWVQTLRTGNRIQVSNKPGINGAPSFSPDGRQLVLTLGGIDGNLDIHVLDLSTRQTRRLTTHRAIDTEGSWSPDGRYIYFTSDRSGGPQVYRVPAAGGTPERVTFEGSYNARPRLSPDGKRLAMVHLDRGNYRIAVMDIKSKELLVVSAGQQDESPSFAPNSDTLIYATRQGRNGVLETVTADGLIRQRVSSGQGDVREPVWSPFPRY